MSVIEWNRSLSDRIAALSYRLRTEPLKMLRGNLILDSVAGRALQEGSSSWLSGRTPPPYEQER